MNLYYYIYQNFINPFLYLYSYDEVLNYCCWIIKKCNIKNITKNAQLKKWRYFEMQLDNYFRKKNHKFNIILNEVNYNNFTTLVLNEIKKIPFSKTVTYKEIAYKINREGSSRAVGQACKKNNFPLIIPCHRVISNKDFGGYMGSNNDKSIQLDIKKKLLRLEGISL